MSKIKKIILFVALAVFFIAGGGLAFIWWYAPDAEWTESKVSPLSAYTIKETPEGEIIENKQEGFKAKVPKGWKAEKTTAFMEDTLYVQSPDLKLDPKTKRPAQGCGFTIDIVKYIASTPELAIEASTLRNRIRSIEENQGPKTYSQRGKVILIDGHKALKRLYQVSSSTPFEITVELPRVKENKIIYFDTFILPAQEKVRCSKALDDFLKTVTIK